MAPWPLCPQLCCPLLLHMQVNDWQTDWVTFYVRQRIQPQMDLVEKGSGDREALELWSALQVSAALPRPAAPCEVGSVQEVGGALCPLEPGSPGVCTMSTWLAEPLPGKGASSYVLVFSEAVSPLCSCSSLACSVTWTSCPPCSTETSGEETWRRTPPGPSFLIQHLSMGTQSTSWQ